MLTEKAGKNLASAAILALAICLVVPSFLFMNNAHSVAMTFGQLLLHAVLYAAALTGALYVLLQIIARWIDVSFVIAGLGLFVALKFLFLPTTVPLLDGTEAFASIATTDGMLSVAFALAVLIACIGAAKFLSPGALGMLAAVLLVVGLQPLLKAENRSLSLPEITKTKSDFVRFSSAGDTLVLVIDTVQSDVALEILEKNPDLAAEWQGFTYFWNHIGKAPTTLMSMLPIYGGGEYAGGSASGQYRTLVTDSIFSDAKAAGHDVQFLGLMFFGCYFDKCLNPSAISSLSPFAASATEYAKLIDIGLMRVLPSPVHERWYDASRGTLQKLTSSQPTGIAEQSAATLRGIARDMEVRDGPPQLKVAHVLGAHRPFVLDRKCRNVGMQPMTRDKYGAFVECNLRLFTDVLRSMKRLGIYDQTTIVALADHGTSLEPPTPKKDKKGRVKKEKPKMVFGKVPTYHGRLGQFTPMFAVKPKGAQNAFQISDAPTQTTDLRATLCAKAFHCKTPVGGADAFSLEGVTDRTRGFIDFRLHQADHHALDGMPKEAYVHFEGTGLLRDFDYKPELVAPREEILKNTDILKKK